MLIAEIYIGVTTVVKAGRWRGFANLPGHGPRTCWFHYHFAHSHPSQNWAIEVYNNRGFRNFHNVSSCNPMLYFLRPHLTGLSERLWVPLDELVNGKRTWTNINMSSLAFPETSRFESVSASSSC